MIQRFRDNFQPSLLGAWALQMGLMDCSVTLHDFFTASSSAQARQQLASRSDQHKSAAHTDIAASNAAKAAAKLQDTPPKKKPRPGAKKAGSRRSMPKTNCVPNLSNLGSGCRPRAKFLGEGACSGQKEPTHTQMAFVVEDYSMRSGLSPTCTWMCRLPSACELRSRISHVCLLLTDTNGVLMQAARVGDQHLPHPCLSPPPLYLLAAVICLQELSAAGRLLVWKRRSLTPIDR